KLAGGENLDTKALDPKLREWVESLDAYHAEEEKKDVSAGDFEVEANRACYAKGQTRAVTNRLVRMIHERPDARYIGPAASLVLDTYVVSQDWEGVVETSDRLSRIKNLGDATFAKKLRTAGSDALYKRVEALYQAKDFKKTLSLAEKFLEKYPTSERAP